MNDLPREILKDMVRRFGKSLAQDPVRCEGLLRDSCSKCNREIFVLVNAVRQRVPADLIVPRHALPLSLMKGFLAKRLQDELGLSDEASRWAVESWAEALDIADPDNNPGELKVFSQASPANPSPVRDFPAADSQCKRWIDDLKTGSPPSRLDAISGLSHTPGPGSLGALIDALDNSEVSVREAAFDAISSRGEEAIPCLAGRLGDAREGIVWRSVLILGGMRAKNATGPLIGLLDRTGKARLCSIWALGEFRSREAITPLMKFVDHPDPAVRKEALGALKKIGGE